MIRVSCWWCALMIAAVQSYCANTYLTYNRWSIPARQSIRSRAIEKNNSTCRSRHILRPLNVVVIDERSTDNKVTTKCQVKETTKAQNNDIVEDRDEERDYWLYRIMLLFIAMVWGTNFGVIKFIENTSIPASVAAATRFGIAAIALSPFLKGTPKNVLFTGLECGLWVALGYLTQAIGLESTDANKSAFICSLTVVIVPVINWFKGKGIKLNAIVASAFALIGTGILELGDAATPSWGDLWSLGQAFGFGIAFSRIESAVEKFPKHGLQLAASQLVSVASASLLWSVIDMKGYLPDFSFLGDSKILLAISYTGLITTALAVYLETIALKKVSASEMTIILSTEPLWATAFASVLLGETLGHEAAVGAFFILTACLIAEGPKILDLLTRMRKEA